MIPTPAENIAKQIMETYQPQDFVVKRFCNTSVQSTYSNISLRMAYDIRYKNAVVHGCMWYKQNVPRAVERLLMCFAKFGERPRCVRAALIAMKNQPFDSLSLTAECFAKRSDCQVTRHTPSRQTCDNAAAMQINNRTVISDIASMEK